MTETSQTRTDGSPKEVDTAARATDRPPVSVHVLSQFVYCQRAGLIAYQQQRDEQEWADPNITYRPCYDLAELEASLNHILNRLWVRLGLLAIAISVTVGLAIGFDVLLALFWSILLIPATILVSSHVNAALELVRTRKLIQTITPQEFDPAVTENQSVNWWALLRAGFEPTTPKAPLFDEELNLSGRPWRYLRHGDVLIPVIRLEPLDAEREIKLYRQHYVRIAAYCHLLEACVGGSSPYGVILWKDRYQGVAISHSQVIQDAFQDELRKSRENIRAFHGTGFEPPAPERRKICFNCPTGQPRPNEQVDYDPPTIYPRVSSYDGRLYRSPCGDHYSWVPPHEEAFARELIVIDDSLTFD